MEKELKEEMGNRIKKLMREKGMSQPALAKAAGLSTSSISLFTHGKRIPSEPTLKRIASVLEADPEYIIWGEDNPKPEIKLAMELLESSVPKMTIAQKADIQHTVMRITPYRNPRTGRNIAKIGEDGQIVAVYKSAREAAVDNGIAHQTVLSRCRGKVTNEYRTGYTFRFQEEIVKK